MPRRWQGGFGALLRAHRRRAGMTQRELAVRAGVSAGAIRDLEQGRTRSPLRNSVEVIAAALRAHPGRRSAGFVRMRRLPGAGDTTLQRAYVAQTRTGWQDVVPT